METCVRGFSFMPESKVDVMELQFIEPAELERTWKENRRQRMKDREQKIWEEFVKEQDIVTAAIQDDPYQFLDDLPEDCLQELIETELVRMQDPPEDTQGEDDMTMDDARPLPDNQTVIYEREEEDVMFHVFDDEKQGAQDDDDEAEADAADPPTVREVSPQRGSGPPSPNAPSIPSTKSTENVTNLIENSIYCAKVKDLRIKTTEELQAMMISLEQEDIFGSEPADLRKKCKRAAEFCARFSRIYLYQLKRQIHDIKRHNSLVLPFAKHTQFQSQMVRIVSLYQNILQAFQGFHKSFPQTGCLGAGAECARALCDVTRAAGRLCPSAAAHDDLLETCNKMDTQLEEYIAKANSFMTEDDNTARSSKSKKLAKKSSNVSKAGGSDANLSMYSAETFRVTVNPKPAKGKENPLGTSSKRRTQCKQELPTNLNKQKKSGSRRPLMRGPESAPARPRRSARDEHIHTLVEAVLPCTSGRMSPEGSPHLSPRRQNEDPVEGPSTSGSNTSPSAQVPAGPAGPAPPTVTPVRSPKSPHTPRETVAAKNRKSSPAKSNGSVKVHLNKRRDPRRPLSPVKLPPRQEEVDDSDVTRTEHYDTPALTPRERSKLMDTAPASCEVTRLIQQLCGGDAAGGRLERVSGSRNAQLVCVTGGSPRQPSTPQLLKILEETIQKKVPKSLYNQCEVNEEKLRLTFSIPSATASRLFQYRTQFVQHMLASAMYANSALGKPWETVQSVSDIIIDELLRGCAKEIELEKLVGDVYKAEMQ